MKAASHIPMLTSGGASDGGGTILNDARAPSLDAGRGRRDRRAHLVLLPVPSVLPLPST